MKPTDRLTALLNDALRPRGLRVCGEIDYPVGAHRRDDCCRWVVEVARIGGGPVMSAASWDTVTDCARRGIEIEIGRPKSEAGVMVSARAPSPTPTDGADNG